MTSSLPENQETAPPLLSKTCQNCYHLKIRRIEALESKIDELMRSRASSPANDTSIAPETTRERSLSSSSPGSSNGAVLGGGPRSSGDVIEDGFLTMERANHLVGIYKTTLTTHFPFVVIPPQTSAETLRHERPFLFLAVLAASSFHDMPLQRILGGVLKQTVNDRMIQGATSSFEFLQGLLVFLAWSHFHPKPRRYSQFLQLAISIVSDLRLDRKPIGSWENHVGSRLHDPNMQRNAPPEWGSDEKRALAGCFYLSSTVSKLLQKLNAFPYTRYLEECCVSLCEQYEYPSDEHLYYIIRLQRIMEAIEYMTQQHTNGPTARAAVLDLRSQLESFRNHLPFDLSDNQPLFMQYHTAEMYLCQAASFSKTTAQLLDADAAAMHAELLSSGITAAKSLLDYYLQLPVYADMAFNNSEWIQISFAITVSSRLAITTAAAAASSSATNPQQQQQTAGALRQTPSLDLSSILRHLSLRIGALVTQQVDARGGRDIFYDYEQRVRRMQAWYERCFGSGEAPIVAPRKRSSIKVEHQHHQHQHHQQPITSAPQQQHGMTMTGVLSAPPFTHDALGLLSQPPSGATTPVNLYPAVAAAEPAQSYFPNLAGGADPCGVWSADSSQANTPDMKMTELFPELDYIFCDWLSPPIET
ncbi:hypothetical protein SLS62_003320 [Diatrype stigma]|uniref:Transcription factor domain-containing protein n=1 Tax=Diatrype stigma TaxID=117547 RepID=A0AAN9YUU3_9PEZI